MRKLIIFLLVALVTETTIAQNYNPAVTAGTILPAPISTGYANIQFVVGNSGGDPLNLSAHPGQAMLLVITLSKGVPNNADPIAAISGSFKSKFSWQYNASIKTFMGTQVQDIGGLDAGYIIIAYKVTTASTLSNPTNGFIVNLTPPGYTNGSNTTSDDVTSSYTFGAPPGPPVPIKLLTFTATKQSKVVNLNWATANEINSSHFDVQYSKDAIQWQSIGRVTAAGNSNTEKTYSLVHNTPANGINYYRLKQVDMDAKFEYSLIRPVTFSTGTTITISPNPTTDRILIRSEAGGIAQSVTIFAADGRQMMHVNNFSMGNSIDMHNYAPGMYMLKIVDKEGKAELRQVVKQ